MASEIRFARVTGAPKRPCGTGGTDVAAAIRRYAPLFEPRLILCCIRVAMCDKWVLQDPMRAMEDCMTCWHRDGSRHFRLEDTSATVDAIWGWDTD